MRGPFGAMRRWWKESNGNGNGHGDSNGHGRGANGDGEHPVGVGARADDKPALEAPRPEAPPPEPPWFAQLDREGIPRTLRYPTTTLSRIVDQAADRFGDVIALVYNHN